MKKYLDIVQALPFEEKAMLLTGDVMNTRSLEKYGIGTVQFSDATAGVRCPWKYFLEDGGDVAFPSPSAMAATFNRDMLNKIGHGLGRGCIAHEVDVLLAPAINIQRNPLCGRNYEYFSEDPYLTGEMAVEYIKGIQDEGVGTCVKHFAMNHQEHYRMHINSECDERAIRELYFPGFEAAVKKANPTSFMCAYNKVNGIFCSENEWLLTDVLRKEWGFEGAVISDWGAVHNPAKCIHAGLDLVMPESDTIVADLQEGLDKGWCTMEDIDLAAARVLKLADTVLQAPRSKREYIRAEYHELAREAAADSMVLLQNDDSLLPIDPKRIKKLTVLGRYAEDPVTIGGYYDKTMEGGGGGVTVDPASVDSPLTFIRQYAEEAGIELIYEPLYDAFGGSIDMPLRDVMIKAIDGADLVLFFIGNPPYYEMEGDDRQCLSLPFHLTRLATDVPRYNPNCVFVQQNGCAISPYFFIKPPKGILQMWTSGEGGGKAVADILFGKANPCGKLPMTFMKELDPRLDIKGDGRKITYHEGLEVGYRYYDKHPEQIWFPFGHGLSYTEFAYSNIAVTPDRMDDNTQAVTVRFDITNVGKVAGKEVAQLYVQQDDPSVVRPIKELKGFEKVELQPGETKTVEITLDRRAFSYYNVCLHDWYMEQDTYHLLVGSSSQDIRLSVDVVYDSESGYTLLRDQWGQESQVIMA